MKLRYLIPFLLAGVALGQSYSKIVAEASSPTVAPSVIIPAGATYRWGDPVNKLWCAPVTVTTSTTIFDYNFAAGGAAPPTCLDAKGKPVADISPGNLKELDGLQTTAAWTATVVPVKGDPLPVIVPAAGGTIPPVIPTNPALTEFVCPGAPVTFTITNADGTSSSLPPAPSPPAYYYSTNGAKAVSTNQGACTTVTQ